MRRSAILAASAFAVPSVPPPTTALYLATDSFKLENTDVCIDDRVEHTVMGWLRCASNPGAGHEYIAWNLRATSSGNVEDVEVTNNPAVVNLFLQRAGATVINALGTTTVPLDTWVHLAVSRVGTTLTAYLNGVAAASGTTTRVPGDTAPTIMRHGSWNADLGYLYGGLFAWKYWTAGLSQAEVQAEMAQILPVRAANFAALYPFTSGTDLAEHTAAHGAWTLTVNLAPMTTIAPPTIPWAA